MRKGVQAPKGKIFFNADFWVKKANKKKETFFIRLYPVYTILTNISAKHLQLYISTSYQQEFFQTSLDKKNVI